MKENVKFWLWVAHFYVFTILLSRILFPFYLVITSLHKGKQK